MTSRNPSKTDLSTNVPLSTLSANASASSVSSTTQAAGTVMSPSSTETHRQEDIDVQTFSQNQAASTVIGIENQVEEIHQQKQKDSIMDDRVMRKNVRIANARMRIFFVASLLITAALVIAITVVLGLNQAYQDGLSLEVVNQVRFRSQQIATNVYMILSDPDNTTLLQFVANDLESVGANFSRGLYILEFGNVTFGLTAPIRNTAVSEQFVLLAPLENATQTAIQSINKEVFLFNATYVNLAIMDELELLLAVQPMFLNHLDNLNALIANIFLSDVKTGQTEIYVFNGVILGILVFETLFIFIPLERRSRRVLSVLTKKNENLNRLMYNLTILTQLNPNGIFRADNEGLLTYVNTRWFEITGLSFEDGLADQWLSHVHPDDREIVRTRWESTLYDPSVSMAVEFRFVRPDGREIWIFGQSISEKDGGRILSLVGALTDITERKLLEQNTFNALAHAAQVQQQRAQEAEQHRLEQVRFIDIICHEIRNPLNGLVNNVDILRQNRQVMTQALTTSPLNETSKQILPILREEEDMWRAVELCIHHQKRITDDVLHISRLQAGHFSIQERSFVLGRLVDSVVTMFHAEAELSHVQLTTSYSSSCSGSLRLKCDSHRTAQILINLVANAIKFTKQRPTRIIDINVDLQNIDEASNKAMLIFQVKDTGIGMTQEEMAKLFIPFGQASTKTYSTYGGSGMGLFLSKALLDLMNGSISVQSQPDVGSTFVFQVPCSILPADAPVESDDDIQPDRPLFLAQSTNSGVATGITSTVPSSSTTEAAILTAEQRTSTEQSTQYRILVVEDNDINQKVLRRQLESVPNHMFLVTVASNGQEAVDLVAQNSFDLIIMDVEMPVLGGLEATKKIREMEQDQSKPSVPVVGLSGNARQEHIDLAKASGMTDYLVKPCRRPELLNCIALHLHITLPV